MRFRMAPWDPKKMPPRPMTRARVDSLLNDEARKRFDLARKLENAEAEIEYVTNVLKGYKASAEALSRYKLAVLATERMQDIAIAKAETDDTIRKLTEVTFYYSQLQRNVKANYILNPKRPKPKSEQPKRGRR